MRLVSRTVWPLACLLAVALASVLHADLIFLKDGFVVQGTVRREVTAEFDPVSKDMTLIPKGFFMLDDGPRRIYFAPSQVRIVEKLPAPSEERVISHSGRLVLNPRILPPHLEVVEVGKWNLKRWERDYAFRSPDFPRVGVTQGIAAMSPLYVQVDAVTKFRWSCAYLTREWDPDTVLELLKSSPRLQPGKKDAPGQYFAKRLSICDFLTQAGWFDHAAKELDVLEKEFADQKERVASARAMLERLRLRDHWEETKNWYQAGRYDAVRQRVADFPVKNVPERMQIDVREMKTKLYQANDQVAAAYKALDETARAATTPVGKALASAVATIKGELHPATVARLDAFLGQWRDAERQKDRDKKPGMGTDQLLGLAVSGWLLGSPSAEGNPEAAVTLWKSREMALAYLRATDERGRQRVLDEYQSKVTPKVDLDEVAQVIGALPPSHPARDLSPATTECQVGAGRQQVTYALKLPPEYTHNRAYPVLLVLPAAGEAPAAMIDRFAKLAADHGYILAAPQWARGLSGEYAYSEKEHDTALETLRDLKRRFNIDEDRVFLFGLGEGAKMAFDVGLAHPDLFAGLLPMAAGPSLHPKRYWRNAQYLAVYAVNGSRGADSQTLLREQFNNWALRGYPALWVEYKGRGTEFFSAELPTMFDWMRHQKRAFPLRQLGTDGTGTAFGNEFCTMRAEDNRFWWLSTSSISARHLASGSNWNNATQPAAITGRIDPVTNEVVVKTQGMNDVTVWFGRNPAGQYTVDLDKPVTIRVNLRPVWANRKVTPRLAVLLDDLAKRGDRKHLYVAKVDLR